ncbi:MAG TPA: hypothetical protein VF137_05045 [Candidatus Dormibacteraeota bacterium]
MSRRRLAALAGLLVVACSWGAHSARPGLTKTQLVAALRALDAEGTAFQLRGLVTDGGARQAVNATGHFKRGNVEMAASSGKSTAALAIVDGALYGESPGSNHWLEMSADPATFLWPAVRPSLLWEAMLLSPSSASPLRLGGDQVVELAGGLAGDVPDAFARSAHGQLWLVASGSRVRSWRVTIDASGLSIDSQLTIGAVNTAEVQAPRGATAGNVLSLFNTSTGALA